MILTETEIVCPRGNSVSGTMIVDLKEISKVEARIMEVQAVTPQKAPELLAVFTYAWKELHRNMVFIMKEKADAERILDRVRASVILDRVPEIIKERKLDSRSPMGSQDIREAILAQDSEYDLALDKVNYLEAVIELLKGKLTAFDMAFTSIKKILHDAQMMKAVGG